MHKMLLSKYWNALIGGYWENDLWVQNQKLLSLPLADRQEFYLQVMLHCKLDTSSATMFAEIAGKDSQSFKAFLNSFMLQEGYQILDEPKKEEVRYWASYFSRHNEN